MLLLLLACQPPARERVEPTFIEVTLGTDTTGSAEAPLPFATEAVSVPISVRTLDIRREPHPFSGTLNLQVRPAQLEQDPKITVTDGAWEGSVTFRAAFGPTRIWVTDEGDPDPASTRVPSWAAGVSGEIWYAFPTIAEMQATDDPETNQLEGEYAELRIADRQVVVTARETAGFWATDIADDPGTGNSIYVYTFSRPDDELAVGKRLTLLKGIDQEYLASTQLSYPSVETDGTDLAVPAAIELVGADVCDEAAMELLEASRVVATDWQIPDTFAPGSDEYADFEEYGQWPLTVGGCTVYVESGVTAPDFYPPDFVGQTIPSAGGMLKQIFDKWVIVVVDGADLVAPQGRQAHRHPTPARRVPRTP